MSKPLSDRLSAASHVIGLLVCVAAWSGSAAGCPAQSGKMEWGETIRFGRDERISLRTPKSWTRQKPRVGLIDFEFSAPHPDHDAGRVTILGAGGSTQANIDRWKNQFALAARKFQVSKKQIAGQEVHLVDLSGTYLDRPAGPHGFGKVTQRANFRVLAAIIVTRYGRYYVKLVGPQPTVAAHRAAFTAMVNSLSIRTQ